MMICGYYDGLGDFVFWVGLLGKSGVGGGILVIVLGCVVIVVWFLGLNRYGNFKLGIEVMEFFVYVIGWFVFGVVQG